MSRTIRYTPNRTFNISTGEFQAVTAFEQFYLDALDWLVSGRERRNMRVELDLADGHFNVLSVSVHGGHLAVYQWGDPSEPLLFAPFERDARAVAVAGDPGGLLADVLGTACMRAELVSAL